MGTTGLVVNEVNVIASECACTDEGASAVTGTGSGCEAPFIDFVNESPVSPTKKEVRLDFLFFWWGQQDSNL